MPIIHTRNGRLWPSIAIVLVVAACIGFGYQVYDHTAGVWTRLRSAASRIEPDGFAVRSRVELGTTLCLISCDSARIELILGTEQPDSVRGCEDLARSLEVTFSQKAEDPEGFADPGCSFVPLPEVHPRGFIAVRPVPVSRNCTQGDDVSCFLVTVSSGLD
jgi:hypothetical protein